MSDTIQIVRWCIEYECPFRRGNAVANVEAANDATWRLRVIEAAAVTNDIYGDICVTGSSYSKEGTSPIGWRISPAVEAVGGLEAARRTCRDCPANATSGKLAGCCSALPFVPYDKDFNGALNARLIAHGLRREFEETFTQTRPIAYGLWMQSPLSARQAALLGRAIPDAFERAENDDVIQFRAACTIAVERGLRLHVLQKPPGHVDMGTRTTFPHCPRCKRGNGEEWTEYTRTPITCGACGHRYVPAETAASVPDDYEPDDDLEATLSKSEYAALLAQWKARHRGEPPSRLEQLMDEIRLAGEARLPRWKRVWNWLCGRRR
jgi:hypothetical protein